MYNAIRLAAITLAATLLCSFSKPEPSPILIEDIGEPYIKPITAEIVSEKLDEDITSSPLRDEIPVVVAEEIIDEVPEEPSEQLLSEEEIELIALVTMAEAEGESEQGKRLVIDTILNRVDSELSYFPDSVTEVIYQSGQFSSMWNGRVDRCYIMEDICELVREELESRTNTDVMYFHAGKFGKYGTPLLVEGNHYFSSI